MKQVSYLDKEQRTAFDEVTERIIRQTMESLLFEEIISIVPNEKEWSFTGKTVDGNIVEYSCEAAEKWSFGRVKIVKNSIKRKAEPCTSLYVFLEEVIQNQLAGAHTTSFIHELLETLAKDTQSKEFQPARIPDQDQHYEALESHMVDGHPYHPSYKSRLGFSLKDNYAYGPEFNQEVSLQWIAVSEMWADVSLSDEESLDEIYKQHLTEEDRLKFNLVIKEKGSNDKKYVFFPVHPWQWEHPMQSIFVQHLRDKDILHLGTSSSPYRAQQSIRTLAHRGNAAAAYIKLALSITNTSTSRILAHHTTQNAPRISDWLSKIIQNDRLLQQERVHILKEVMGMSFRYDQLSPIQYRSAYGMLGAIYRENVSTYLDEQEEAWPLNALLLTQKNGVPFIQAAIEQYGVDKWSDALIRTVTLPIIHLLYAHGIALESHAQNIILVVENHFPKSIILKDLHDSVRYVPDKLLQPDWAPKLNPEPETHRKFNRYSFIQAEAVSEVRDYTYDAFFFICMTDICLTFEKFGLSEADFWRKCTATILSYQQDHPEFKDRFEMFDLFGEDALIEEMTKRRIYGDSELYFRKVKNPLLRARDALA
ncbi:IucA/IucC family siderophore biosynthesis protein [Paenibacillus psychroresistens]|uniref:IucA/IucC family siderophore biosynthesis protein n=1 Tax=Paenibacillus psychroresistens TaxID=1778678 RepID=A0A6B8RUJ1_9BACL|nr:IucA/IucC family protein [Paenibacillus psychroresistens]QGQ99113.1 IucA/IucC family siderophore biosynthesis protein [Paenibacillus psychroresistens]